MRRQLAVALLIVLVVSSGCIGFLTGQSALTFAADDVSVSEQARSDTGYEQARDDTQVINRTFRAGGQTRNVTVTNHVAEYQRSVSLLGNSQPLARMTVISSPAVAVAGQTFNPLGELSNRELAQRLQQQYETVQNVQFEGDRTRTVLGENVTVSRFSAEATTVAGQNVDVYVHVTKTKDGDDFVVGVAVYPQGLDGEQQTVDTLFAGIEHETGES
ncbi:DUF6517 family protein [Salinirubellus salinus]|uniref:DUF6517 family protein n=1 Tax=Salinirubellus salinus TaxID=1364945 RepID=A0A9E7UCC5_9EURY|nr:DUF6517 family protein [Salinirubellus salinus]UWM55654.1 DUF6517 family protein [Salinirubellus salinus]